MSTICLTWLMMLTLTNDSVKVDSADIARMDSVWKNVNIENVVVEGKNVIHYPDKDVYRITREMRKNTIDTYDILEKLPGVWIDRIDKSVSFKGRSNVVVIMDGIEKDIDYIGNLHNMRFKSLEVYEHGHVRYPNADVVINIITKERWQGFDISNSLGVKALPSASYGSLFSKANEAASYTYSRPKFDFSTHLSYNHSNRKYSRSVDFVQLNRYDYHLSDDGKPNTSQASNGYGWWADMDYKIDSLHTISAKYRFETSDYNSRNDLNYFLTDRSNNAETTVARGSRNDDDSRQHTMTLYYRGNTEKWQLYSDMEMDLYSDNVMYSLKESSGFSTKSQWHNTRKVYAAKMDVKRLFQKSSLGFLVSGFYRQYKGVLDSGATMDNTSDMFFDLSLSYHSQLSKTLSYNLHFVLGDYAIENKHQTSLSGAASFSFIPARHWSVRLNFSSSRRIPRYQQIRSVVTREDSLTYSRGNLDLKSTLIHGCHLSVNFYQLYVLAHLQYTANKMSPEYILDDNMIIRSYTNANETSWYVSVGLSPLRSKNRRFSLQADLTREGGHVWNGPCSNTYDHWSGTVDTRYTGRNSGVIVQYKSVPKYSLYLQGLDKNVNDFWRITPYQYLMKKRLLIQLTYMLPVKWGIGKNVYSHVSTPFYKYNAITNDYKDSRNYIFLSVRYLLAKGHSSKKISNSQGNLGSGNENSHD